MKKFARMMPARHWVISAALSAAVGFSATGLLSADALTTPGVPVSGQQRLVSTRPDSVTGPDRQQARFSRCPGRTPHSAVQIRQCGPSGHRAGAFSVGGQPAGPLYPGVSRPLNLTFLNSGSASLRLRPSSISAANITITSHAPGCRSSWFAVTRELAVRVTVPHTHGVPVSLKALGVPRRDWPAITMRATNTDQDACRGVTLRLTFSGIEATP